MISPRMTSRSAWAALLRHPHIGALAAGALAACGFQPLAWWPATIVGIAWLIELLARAPRAARAFQLGWLFGLAHFTVGDNWIATAFTYQAEMPAWLGVVAVVLLSLYLALFPACAALGAWLLAKGWRRGAGRIELHPATMGPALAGFWIVTEWMRAWVFTGFAWNPLGVSLLGQFASQGLAVLSPWIGTYGLSGVLVLIAAALHRMLRQATATHGGERIAWAVGILALAGALALQMTLPMRGREEPAGELRYTLIQPDLRQETLDDPRDFEPNFIKMARLTIARRPGDKRLVFWPESGVADYLRDGYPDYLYRQMTYAEDPVLARQRIGQVIGPYSLLLTGAVDLDINDDRVVGARNAVTAIDWRGSILGGYAKAHLVPYGEYLALGWLLEPLGARRLVAGSIDFLPGPGARTLDFGDYGKAGVQICYEIVFSGQVVDRSERPDYIFNPSNDGWFGSWGPPQHLAQARLRAIEEGLPVLRSTTTGISAVVDADGLVRAFLPRHVPGRLDGRIPLAHEPTAFARYGNVLPLVLAALLLAASVVARSRRKVYPVS